PYPRLPGARSPDIGSKRASGTFIAAILGVLLLVPAAPASPVTIAASMEGAFKISPRDFVAAGYEFRLPGSRRAAEVTFSNASVTISGPCSNGGTGTITIWLDSGPYRVPAGDAGWHPGSATYQGAAQAPASLCGGGGSLDASAGATFA